jgi:gliding motility-associated transport system permease protein
MRGFWTIYKREIKYYFSSPVPYVLFITYLFLVGWIISKAFLDFSQQSIDMNSPQMRAYGMAQSLNITTLITNFFGLAGFFLMFVLPLLTMRLFADETRMGTSELLFSYPVKDIQIVLGKYFASLSVVLILFMLASVSPFLVWHFGEPEPGVIMAGYIGLILLASTYLAIGLFVSACTENQIIAAIIPFGLMFALWLLGDYMIQGWEQFWRNFMYEFSTTEHFKPFLQGAFSLKDVVYYFCIIFISLFLTLQVLESRKWRGQA